jgi:hypothetical protein
MKVENKYKHNSRISSIKPCLHRFLVVRAYELHPSFMAFKCVLVNFERGGGCRPYEYPHLNELSITTIMIERDLLG